MRFRYPMLAFTLVFLASISTVQAFAQSSVAALTIYDMTKALDKSIVIRSIQLESKSGGKSGDYQRS